MQMPLVAIRWARRDDPVVLKRKKKKRKRQLKALLTQAGLGRNCCRIWEGKGKEAKERKKDK